MRPSVPAPGSRRHVRHGVAALNLLATLAAIAGWRRLPPAGRLPAALGYAACRALLFHGSMGPNCGWFSPVLTRFQTSRREVWLTLDDGPHPGLTPAVLDILDRFDAKATFFLVGRRVQRWPELTRRIVDRGHQTANHTLTHPAATFWCALRDRLQREIHGASFAISSITGRRPVLFRAPAGIGSPLVHSILERQRMIRVGWSARGYDAGVLPGPAVERIMKRLRPGSIILLHAERDAGGPHRLASLLAALHRTDYTCVLPFPDESFA